MTESIELTPVMRTDLPSGWIIKISQQINQPPNIIIKFFEVQLQRTIHSENDKYYLDSECSVSSINNVITTFVNDFVKCQQCGYCSTVLCVMNDIVTTGCTLCSFNKSHENTAFTEYFKTQLTPSS